MNIFFLLAVRRETDVKNAIVPKQHINDVMLSKFLLSKRNTTPRKKNVLSIWGSTVLVASHKTVPRIDYCLTHCWFSCGNFYLFYYFHPLPSTVCFDSPKRCKLILIEVVCVCGWCWGINWFHCQFSNNFYVIFVFACQIGTSTDTLSVVGGATVVVGEFVMMSLSLSYL